MLKNSLVLTQTMTADKPHTFNLQIFINTKYVPDTGPHCLLGQTQALSS